MSEKPRISSPDKPRAVTREVLSLADQNEVLEGLSPHLKAEVYGIMAYFIKKAAANFRRWQDVNPGTVLIANTKADDEVQRVQTNVIGVPESVVTERSKLSVTTFELYRVLHGSMHYHLKPLVNTYTPGPIVNTEDIHILDRLDSLLIDQHFRDGARKHSEEFLLAVAQPQARFIASTLFGALQAYETQFGVLPVPGSEAFSVVMTEAKKAIIRLATMNIQDFGKLEERMIFYGNEESVFVSSPYEHVTYETSEVGQLRMIDQFTANYKPSKSASIEPTIGCPALFGRVDDSGSAIGTLTDYAIGLLGRSHYTELANFTDENLRGSIS